MEIIKPGITPQATLFEGECRYCGAVIRFTDAECTRTVDAYETWSVHTKCPTEGCGAEISVQLRRPRR